MNSGEPDAHHIDSLLSLSDGLEGMASWEGMNMRARIARRSNFFGACRAEFPISAPRRIVFIPSHLFHPLHRAGFVLDGDDGR